MTGRGAGNFRTLDGVKAALDVRRQHRPNKAVPAILRREFAEPK